MKKLKLIVVAILFFIPATYLVADCIGNTTHSCVGETISGNGGVNGETWCCTSVGDGTDYSCTNGQNWQLSSNISGCIPGQLVF